MTTVTAPRDKAVAVDGQKLFDDISAVLTRYVTLSPHATEAVALFTLYTHVFPKTFVSPLLILESMDDRNSTFTLLEVLSRLVPRPMLLSNASTATLFRVMDRTLPTLLLADVEHWFFENKELRDMLDSGRCHSTASVRRPYGAAKRSRQFSTWCPKVLTFSDYVSDGLAKHAIVVPVRSLKSLGDEPFSLSSVEQGCEKLRTDAARWALGNVSKVESCDPEIPEELSSRVTSSEVDNWRPLLAIADLCGLGTPASGMASAEPRKALSEAAGPLQRDPAADAKRLAPPRGLSA